MATSMRIKSTERTRMQNQKRIPLRKSAIDQTLDRAVQRVYEAYGSNLNQFLATIQEQRLQEAEAHKAESARRTPTGSTSPDRTGR